MAIGTFVYVADPTDNALCSPLCPRYRHVFAPESGEHLEYCVLFSDAIDRQRGAECLAAEEHARGLFPRINEKDTAA